MKIRNKTDWSTRDIRRLVAAVLRFEKADPEYRKALRVHVVDRIRSGQPAGSAPYNETWMTIRLYRSIGRGDDFRPDVVQIAGTIAHEMLHNRGVKHKEMAPTYLFDSPARRALFAWASKYPINPKRKREQKPRPTLRDARDAHARRMLIRAERDARSAARRIRLWSGRVRRYERERLKLVAETAPKEG